MEPMVSYRELDEKLIKLIRHAKTEGERDLLREVFHTIYNLKTVYYPSEWISCGDHLPDPSEVVFAISSRGQVMAGRICRDELNCAPNSKFHCVYANKDGSMDCVSLMPIPPNISD